MKKLILGALLLLSTICNANIVYTNMNNIVRTFGSGTLNLDVNNDGTNDFSLTSTFTQAGSGTCSNQMSNNKAIYFKPITSSNNVLNGIPLPNGSNYFSSLNCNNDTININSNFANSLTFLLIKDAQASCLDIGTGNLKQGFRVLKNSQYYYGYIDYTKTNTNDIIIHGYYYENTPHTPIIVSNSVGFPFTGNCIQTTYDTIQVTQTAYDTIHVTQTIYDTLYTTITDTIEYIQVIYDTTQITLTQTVYDTLYLTQTIYDTLYVTENIYDTTYVTVTDTLLIDVNVGIEENTFIRIKVYPSPTKELLVFDFSNYSLLSSYSMNIVNNQGQIMFELLNITNQIEHVNIQNWGPGVYYFYLWNIDGIISTKKIIII
jgi:hypothetical protein